ncbi:hypothetical protein SFOMI_0348 [Sphingobium fuliginis]|uniref:Uncharacterized protein n=1 Tax=Sphingobium fuliginis (strain ATCC 27551) TaxID=336203 RepID=A0A292Z6V3_SPHSA|nr:hypothetical protein SFOMI_0348 [Sphingobium fuliginis]
MAHPAQLPLPHSLRGCRTEAPASPAPSPRCAQGGSHGINQPMWSDQLQTRTFTRRSR